MEINLILSDSGCIFNAKAVLEETDVCKINLTYNESHIVVEGNDFFSCIQQIKKSYPEILIYCKGYKINVYPSRMTAQLSKGLKSYEYQLGSPATNENLVNTFDYEDENLSSSVIEQENFYKAWLKSL